MLSFASTTNNKQPAGLNELWLAWQAFWASKLGEHVLQLEAEQLTPWLEKLQGYHLLNLSSLASPNTLLAASPIKHQINWQPKLAGEQALPSVNQQTSATTSSKTNSYFISQLEALPLPEASQDLVVLHHCLEIAANPEKLLAEAARVVLPKGEILLIGFNPFSLLTASRFLPEFIPNPLPNTNSQALQAFRLSQFISLGQLKTWLATCHLQLEEMHLAMYLPTIKTSKDAAKESSNPSWLTKQLSNRLPGASIYCLRLQKRLGSPLQPRVNYAARNWLPSQTAASPTRSSLRDKPCQ